MIEAFRRAAGAPPLVFGHRGVRGPLPENTLAAFARAADEGADGIELDVRLSGSGDVIVLHDPDLSRVTDARDARLANELAWAELTRVDVGGERIPKLADVLSLARDRGLLVNVELKHDEPRKTELVRGVKRVLAASVLGLDRVILSTFHPKLALLCQAFLPGVGRAFICHYGQRSRRPFAVGRALRAHAIHPEHTLLTPASAAACRRAGLALSSWTINDEAVARELASLGVDSLITDRPGAIRRALGLARTTTVRTLARCPNPSGRTPRSSSWPST